MKPLQITDEERDKLRMIALRPKSAQAMAMRARIVLSCGQGMSNFEVARKLHITGATRQVAGTVSTVGAGRLAG